MAHTKHTPLGMVELEAHAPASHEAPDESIDETRKRRLGPHFGGRFEEHAIHLFARMGNTVGKAPSVRRDKCTVTALSLHGSPSQAIARKGRRDGRSIALRGA